MKRSFRERNPVPLGIIGMIVVALLLLGAFNLQRFTGGEVYTANFSEASGLKPNEEVRIAGVKVGKVESVELDDDHVKVRFRVEDDVKFGKQTKAEIKIKTILGAHYLSVVPAGPGRQDPDDAIPASRNTALYEVVPALQEASEWTQEIDPKKLAKAFDALSASLENSPEEIRSSLRGLQRLSRSIASRDKELNELLGHSRNVTKVLAERSGDFTKLLSDGDLVLREVRARRAVIHQLLLNTASLSRQLQGAIRENEGDLNPALKNLQSVIGVLEKNQGNLEKTFELLGPFASQLTDVTGTGRWFDNYIQNLIPLPVSVKLPGDEGKQNKKRRTPVNRPTSPTLPYFD